MASSVIVPGSSCKNKVAKTATCSASVLEYATPTTKLRCFMASSKNAVAANWLTAPSASQPK
jgi:hypothetical protein